MKNYTEHYAKMNSINLNDKDSIKQWYKRQCEYLGRELNPIIEDISSDSEILDLGCGIGGLLFYLKEKGYKNLSGIDINQTQIDLATENVKANFHCISLNDQLGDNTKLYDVIFMMDLIEHLKKDNIIPTLRKVKEKLNSNGKLIIRTPNMGCLNAARMRYIDFTHEVGFTEESIEYVLNESGYNSVNVYDTYIGKKRKAVITIIQSMVEKIYKIGFAKVSTSNLLVVAGK